MPRGRKMTKSGIEKLDRKIQRDHDILTALRKGIEWGNRWDKEYDKAISMWTALTSEGFEIRKKRTK